MRKERLKSALFRARTLYRRGDIQRAITELESALSEWKGFQRNKVEDALWYQAIAVLNILRQQPEQPTESSVNSPLCSSQDRITEKRAGNESSVDQVDSRPVLPLHWKSNLEKLKQLKEETQLLFSQVEKENRHSEASLSSSNLSVNTLTSKQLYILKRLSVLNRRCRYAMLAMTG